MFLFYASDHVYASEHILLLITLSALF